MEVLVVDVSAVIVSFRRPLDHNYQRTLPQPPPTTLLGLVGAALGLSEEALWREDSVVKNLNLAVLSLDETGRAKDMWTVMKIKSAKIADRSPYFRELLCFPRYLLVFGSEPSLLAQVAQAFKEPAYALSLGREDELITVHSIEMVSIDKGEPVFRGTVIPGDLRQMSIVKPLVEGIRFEAPVVETLPLRFTLKSGKREPHDMVPLSFLPHSLDIRIPHFSEVFSLNGRNFVWMNCLPNRM